MSFEGKTSRLVAHGGDRDPVTVVVPENYQFLGWKPNGVNIGPANPLVLPGVTEATTVQAVFAPERGKLTTDN